MKRTLGTLAAAAGLIVGLSAVATAAVSPGKFNIGPYVGGYVFDRTQDYEGAVTAGARLGLDITKHFGAELGLGFVFTETTTAREEDAKINRYGLDLLYHLLPDSRLDPYLAAGFGGLNLGTEAGGRPTSKGAFDYGIGARYYLTDDIALRADVRHILFSSGQVRNNLEYTAGLSFSFDGRCCEEAKPAPVVAPAPPPPPAAPQANIAATPGEIIKGQNSTLNWTSQNAADCTIDQGIGKVQPQG